MHFMIVQMDVPSRGSCRQPHGGKKKPAQEGEAQKVGLKMCKVRCMFNVILDIGIFFNGTGRWGKGIWEDGRSLCYKDMDTHCYLVSGTGQDLLSALYRGKRTRLREAHGGKRTHAWEGDLS